MALVWSTVVLLLHVVSAILFLVPTSLTSGLRYPDIKEVQLRRGPNAGCRVREYRDHEVVVPGCRPQAILVRGCFGQCQSYEVPILLPPHKVSHHKMCSYEEVKWRTVELQDCEPGVNRTYSYPYAVKCRCRRCDPSDTYCAGI
ncbi:glycoprotein hormone beta-5-like [Patiria miniata]|uniref:CTCK domain-containing protein n=1 Tax=Patiria miniata TaxID=46514 RepID=A0A914B716_PATMI|nr:glycoprotein hormone beta-5-like [Patiria miniata]